MLRAATAMTERVGICSRCGGEVMGVRGGWWSVMPPPPDTCAACGAVRRSEVIDMVPRPGPPGAKSRFLTTDRTAP